MKKIVALLLMVCSMQTHSFFDFRVDADIFYPHLMSKALSYSGLACMLVPLIARSGAQFIKQIKNNTPSSSENTDENEQWERLSNRYTTLGTKLILSGLGLHTASTYISYTLYDLERSRPRSWWR